MDMKLEVVILPVSDMDRAKGLYLGLLGWRLDADFPINDGYRIVQVTSRGSECSVIFGTGLTRQEADTLHGLQLTVTDILKAQEELASRGVEVSGPFHDETGAFHHAGDTHRVHGAHPERACYGIERAPGR